MKKKNVILISTLITSFILVISTTSYGQFYNRFNRLENQKERSNQQFQQSACYNIPDLTAEQISKISDLKIKLRKELLPLNLKIQESKTHLRMIETADNVETIEVDRIIDQISELQTQKMKLKARHKQDIRVLLDENQRVYFDTYCSRTSGGMYGRRNSSDNCRFNLYNN